MSTRGLRLCSFLSGFPRCLVSYHALGYVLGNISCVSTSGTFLPESQLKEMREALAPAGAFAIVDSQGTI